MVFRILGVFTLIVTEYFSQLFIVQGSMLPDTPTDQHATAESIVDTRVPNRSLPFKILAVSLHLPLSLLSHRLIQVAYHGVPEKAYEVFVNALYSCYLKQSLVIPDLEDHNPAGNSVYTVCYV